MQDKKQIALARNTETIKTDAYYTSEKRTHNLTSIISLRNPYEISFARFALCVIGYRAFSAYAQASAGIALSTRSERIVRLVSSQHWFVCCSARRFGTRR